MQYIEYGQENSDVIILLHGGGLSWWNFREAAQALQADYHVILPILDGHAGSDCAFTTIKAQAERIIDFVDARFGGAVTMLGGLSLGAQVLLEILSQRGNICRYAWIESALTEPSRLTHAMIPWAFGSCYGLIRRRWFARLQFRSLRIKQELFEEYYRDTSAVKKADMIAFMQENALYAVKPTLKECTAKAYVFVGEKENAAMKRSAKSICAQLSQSRLQVLPGWHHGEFSINHADRYAAEIRKALGEE